ncbi:hypothetical protein GMOD_00001173 [Pyrenophora seminiperda CCB06]|uniref:Uncharacterized protein n=1 Tax=Pyrenophora seminiperda CCB06 TaxID=1302712 RepID=A0A3M7LYF8_9PLEO|nr:hypothetical protein GMOD_00001173 [Pyrenophora seminiperda CCB06]
MLLLPRTQGRNVGAYLCKRFLCHDNHVGRLEGHLGYTTARLAASSTVVVSSFACRFRSRHSNACCTIERATSWASTFPFCCPTDQLTKTIPSGNQTGDFLFLRFYRIECFRPCSNSSDRCNITATRVLWHMPSAPSLHTIISYIREMTLRA